MSENEKIEAEELRFIYKLILDGCSDSDILKKYTSLKGSGELDFPLRSDESFVENRRKEMETASDVLRDRIKDIIKIFIPKKRDEHLAKIAEISAILLQNNLNTVTVVPNLGEKTYGFRSRYFNLSRYAIRGNNNASLSLNRLQLIEMLRKHVEDACKQYGYHFFYDCYVSHLKATMGVEMEDAGGFWPAIERKPDEVIKAIKTIMDGGDLKGACPACDMEIQLPNFIKSTYSDILKT